MGLSTMMHRQFDGGAAFTTVGSLGQPMPHAGRAQNAASGRPQRIPGLDGLRALSIVLVLMAHATGTVGLLETAAFPAWLPVAELGVGIFFVISGYLITTLLMAERAKTGTISLKDFYIRRAYRIVPAAHVYITVIVLLSMAGVLTLHRFDSLHAISYTTNYAQDRSWWLGHLWSLSVEEQFYLLWPALMLLLSTRGAVLAAVAGVALAPLSRLAIYKLAPSHSAGVGEYFPTICDGLAIGCLLALAQPWLARRERYLRFAASPLFWLVPVAAVASLYVSQRLFLRATVTPLIVNVSIALVIDRCVRFRHLLATRILERRPLVWLGTMSYSLYLWQQVFVNRHADSWIHSFPVSIVLALLAATASHYLVEKPFLRLRQRRSALRAASYPAGIRIR